MSFSPSTRRWFLTTAATLLWLLAVAGGWWWMTRYEFRSGETGTPGNFPEGIVRKLSPDRDTLFVSLHPECSCSVATLGEVERISRECADRLQIVAVFASYDTLPGKVEESRLWKKAAAIPRLTAIVDGDGSLREGLGALTSGDCVLADPQGRVLYHGGITGSRGQNGPSPGGDAVIAFTKGIAGIASAPVFGCALKGKGAP